MARVLTAEDKKFRAQMDAETMVHAEEIKEDKLRLALALKMAMEMARKQKRAAELMARVANNPKHKSGHTKKKEENQDG